MPPQNSQTTMTTARFSINTYITFSALLFFSGGFYYFRIIRSIVNEDDSGVLLSDSDLDVKTWYIIKKISSILSTHRLLYFVLLNSCAAFITLIGKLIVKTAFGNLSLQEKTYLSKKFRRYVQSKIMFIIFVSQKNLLEDAFSWIPWLALQCCCTLINELAVYRQINSNRSNISQTAVCKNQVLKSAGIVNLISSLMIVFSLSIKGYLDVHYCAFLIADGALLFLQSAYIIFKTLFIEQPVSVSIHVIDILYEMIYEFIQFANYIHLILFSQLAFTYSCLFLGVQAQNFYSKISNKIKKHWRHRAIVRHINTRYGIANEADLLKNEKCTICWQPLLKSARKLPCSHVFHEICLRRWLEQDSSCPICREHLDLDTNQNNTRNMIQVQRELLNDQMGNTLQYFIESLSPQNNRFARWWTRFLFESMNDDQIEMMVNQVSEMFPQVSREMVLNLVNNTGSVNLTIDAILAARNNQATAQLDFTEHESDTSSISSNSTDDSLIENNDGNDREVDVPITLSTSSSPFVYDFSELEPPRVPTRLQKSWIGDKMIEMIETNRKKYLDSRRGEEFRSRFSRPSTKIAGDIVCNLSEPK